MRVEEAALDNNGLEGGGFRSKSALSRIGAVGTAVILTGFLVMTVSRAAFVATTENTGNVESTGQIELADNDLDAAMFTDLVAAGPGATEVSCITVTYTGGFGVTPVELYTTGVTGDIAPYLDLVIETGTSTLGGFDDCGLFVLPTEIYNGTVGDLEADTIAGNFVATGWTPATSGETQTFRFTTTVSNDAGAAGRAGGFGFGFGWETQSN